MIATPTWVVYHETLFTAHEYILSATAVDFRWLTELAPHFYQQVGGAAEEKRPRS